MDNVVVIVNGKPRSGKDTFCNFITKYCEEKEVDCNVWSTIDFEKELLEEIVNREYNPKSATDRSFLCDFKRLLNEYYDITFRDFTNLLEFYNGVFLIHTREWAEILKFEEYCNKKDIKFITVFVSRPEEEYYLNDSDFSCGFQKNLYDVFIDNNGSLEDLKANAELFCDSRLF